MLDKKNVRSELKTIASELTKLAQRIEVLEMELSEKGSTNQQKLQVYQKVKNKFFKPNPKGFLLQSEIFSFLSDGLNKDINLKFECVKYGWSDGTSNKFWREFWKWLANQDGISRIASSKNNIKFMGIDLRRS